MVRLAPVDVVACNELVKYTVVGYGDTKCRTETEVDEFPVAVPLVEVTLADAALTEARPVVEAAEVEPVTLAVATLMDVEAV